MVDLEVELANHGNNPILVQIYAADVYSLINGGFGVRLFDEPTSGATRWIDFPSEAFELDGQTSTIRSIQLEIPDDAAAGEYLSALVIQNANPTGGTGEGVGFKQVNRQAIAVAVTLPGELIPGLAFGDVTHKFVGGKSVLLAEVENTGNVHMKLEGQFTVTDSGGAEVLNQPVTMGTVYAGTLTHLEVPVGSALAPGDYRVSVELGNADLNISQQLESALITVPEAPATPIPANAAPAADAAPADAPAAAGTESTSQNGLATWMIVAGIAAALVLGAGGAILGFALMRRKNDGGGAQPAASPLPVITPSEPVSAPVWLPAPTSVGPEPKARIAEKPAVETAPKLDPYAKPHQPKPQMKRDGPQRSSAGVRNLLRTSSLVRGDVPAVAGAHSDDLGQ